MAKTLEGSKWVTSRTKNTMGALTGTWKQKKADPKKYGLTAEDVKLITIPGQAITVKEILERHRKGRPQPPE